MDEQRVPFGRPTPTDDGASMTLEDALNASPVKMAYLRQDPIADVVKEPGIIIVTLQEDGQWQVYHYTFLEHQVNGQGWPMMDFRDAEAFCVYRLRVPRAAVWWPAQTPLLIEGPGGIELRVLTPHIGK